MSSSGGEKWLGSVYIRIEHILNISSYNEGDTDNLLLSEMWI